MDIDRLRAAYGGTGWWDPSRRSMWRYGALLPLDFADASDRASIVTDGEGNTPELPYAHPLARQHGFHLFVKDEGDAHPGFGANPTRSFKDRGLCMTVSMARAARIGHLALPTQGNAGDALAHYAMLGGVRATIVMSPETDAPIVDSVRRKAEEHPDLLELVFVEGTIVDCGKYVREQLVPAGAFSAATFQEPGWRIEGKKTLGLEMAEPRKPGVTWSLPDVIVYPTGGGTGVLGMAKAFDELEALGLVGGRRPRMICVQSSATDPLVRAFESGADDITPRPAGTTIATGLNVAHNVGHFRVLRIIRDTGGTALAVNDQAIRATIEAERRATGFGWSPEGAAALAALPRIVEQGLVAPRDRVVVVNTASIDKYPSVSSL